MIRNMILEKDIEFLEFDNKITNKLKEHNINIIRDLWVMKRNELKYLGFSDYEINQIIIKLQLHGIDHNKRIY